MILDDNVKMNQPRITGMPNPIVSSDRCIKFRLPLEERKFQSKYDIDQTGRMLKDIQDRTGTRIEYQTMKDGSIDFIVYGKESYVLNAKQLILKDFQAPVTMTVPVPKAIHGKLLGPKGVRILEIQSQTQTKITVPRQNEDSDIITIVGLKDNVEKAVERVEKLAKEFAAKSTDRITVERRYLLFITGPFNENIKQWEEKGVKVSTYSHGGPNGTDKDLATLHGGETNFTLVGEQNAIAAVKEEIRQVYEEKKKKCTTVNIEVKKAQHKYITGQRGEKLRTFFAKTGVSVEMPPPGSDSDTITLRGEQSKIGPALSELYTQAHSETDDYFVVDNWLHKFLIGPRRSNTFDFKARGVSVQSSEDCIKLHGSPGEVEMAKDWLEAELNEVSKRIIRKDIKIEARLHGYIIGKSGATVKKIRDESGAHIHVPEHDDPNYKKDVGVITLEGTAEAVALAEEKISSIAKKYEAQKKLIVPHAVHGMIIGKKGEKIKEIRDKFNQITINFPEAGVVSDEINLLGPKEDVENCYQYLTELSSELATITESQVTIPAKLHSTTYMGPKSRTIRQLLDEFKHKIILSYPPKIANTNNNNNNNITNTNNNNNINSSTNNNNKNSNNSSTNNNKNTTVNGTMPPSKTITDDESKKPIINASGDEKAQNKLQSPKSKKGNKDKSAHKVESVAIATSDIVKIRGPKEMVEKARERLQQLAKECQERVDRKFQMVVTTKPEVLDKMSYVERQQVHKIRDQHDVKIGMPERRSGATTARFTIIGIEAKVQAAAAQLETLLKRVEERVEERFSIPSRVHPMLIGSGGRAVKRLMDQYKVEVRFARHDDTDPDSVTLSGHPDDVSKAKAYMVSHAESCMRSVTSNNEAERNGAASTATQT